jgi:flagellar basal body rod protein FlgG
MNVSLYQAAAALNANSRWQEVISENLASSSVPGFKRQELSVAAVQAGLMPANSLNSLNSPTCFSMPKAAASTSFASGDIQFTGNKNDVAIEGPGFIEVRLPNGSLAQTRNGELQVSAQGQLVTKEGYTVMGDTGPILLDQGNTAALSISTTGEVSQGADLKGRLKIKEFNNPNLLTQVSGGYFVANHPNLQALTTPPTSTLRQGYLEMSNTSVVKEMANMITAMRMFEANTKIIQIQDDRLGKVISELGSPT